MRLVVQFLSKFPYRIGQKLWWEGHRQVGSYWRMGECGEGTKLRTKFELFSYDGYNYKWLENLKIILDLANWNYTNIVTYIISIGKMWNYHGISWNNCLIASFNSWKALAFCC
jgi:hypothetical protein